MHVEGNKNVYMPTCADMPTPSHHELCNEYGPLYQHRQTSMHNKRKRLTVYSHRIYIQCRGPSYTMRNPGREVMIHSEIARGVTHWLCTNSLCRTKIDVGAQYGSEIIHASIYTCTYVLGILAVHGCIYLYIHAIHNRGYHLNKHCNIQLAHISIKHVVEG